MITTQCVKRFGCLLMLAFLLGDARTLFSHEIVVRPNPAGEPVLARALKSAAPGDTIRLTKGVYRETLTISKPVSIVGEPGAVIDPSVPFRAKWQAADTIGKGVYRATARLKPQTLFLDGKVVAEIDERRTQEDGPWNWKQLLSVGPPRTGFRLIQAIWIYRSKEKAVYLHLEHDAAPSGLNWSVLWSKEPIVNIRGASDVAIRNLTLAHGYDGIDLIEGARHCTVSHCTIGPWDQNGVLAAGNDISECIIENNEIFRGALEDWTPDPLHEDSSDKYFEDRRYEVWRIHKNFGFYDRVGINLVHAGSGNRIHANHVYDTFDGIDVEGVEDLDKPLLDPYSGSDTEIWENVVERTRDSGMELGGGCINVRVHDNVLRQTHGGLRYKVPRIGPVFIYRNVLVDGSPYNIWYSMGDSPAEGYVYHNTIVGGDAGLGYGFGLRHHVGTPHWHYLNNLVIARRGFFISWRENVPANFTADYNLAVGGGKPWPDDPTKDTHSLYLDALPLAPGFPPTPLPDSAAVDAGLDLSTYFHGKPLPGCEPGYFRGKAPDIGAVEIK